MERKTLSQAQIDHIMAVTTPNITKQWLIDTFAFTEKGSPKVPFQGEFELDTSKLEGIKMPKFPSTKFKTTAGRYIFNRFLFGESTYAQIFSYVNEPVHKGVYEDLNNMFLDAILEEKTTPKDYIDFLNKITWFSFSIVSLTIPGLSIDIYKQKPNVEKLKEKLIKENKEAIEKADIVTCRKIEDECNELYKEDLKGTYVADYIDSRSAKNVTGVTAVMRGLVAESRDPRKFNFVKSSLQEGIKPDEIHNYADNGVFGAKARGLNTRVGGYITKKFNAAMSHLVLDKEGSDCNSKYGITTVVDKTFKKNYYLRYAFAPGGKYILMDNENIKKYMGQKVKLRSPMFCTGDRICNKCAGELYYRLKNRFLGLAVSRISNNLLNASLKNFHESTVKTRKIEIEDYITKV